MVFFFQMRLEKVFFIRTNENAVLHQIRLVFDESLPSCEAFLWNIDSKRQKLFIQKFDSKSLKNIQNFDSKDEIFL